MSEDMTGENVPWRPNAGVEFRTAADEEGSSRNCGIG